MDFLGHVISHDGVGPNKDKIVALTRMPMPTDIKQFRSSIGGLSYYRKVPAQPGQTRPPDYDSSQKWSHVQLYSLHGRSSLRPPHIIRRSTDTCLSSLGHCYRQLFSTLRLHCDANTDVLGATLEQISLTALSALSSTLVKHHLLMSGTGPPWCSKPDASCGVSGAFATIYSACSS